MNFPKRKWKGVKDYENYYQVSNLGEVKSIRKGKLLKQTNTTTGYKKVELQVNNKRKGFKVHRLVAEAFIENPQCKPHVNHINGNKTDNRAINLEWVTPKENAQHAIDTELRKLNKYDEKEVIKQYEEKVPSNKICEKHGFSSIVLYRILRKNNIKVRSISEAQNKYELSYEFVTEQLKNKTQKDLAKEIGCDASLISKYKNNKIRK